jgi:hypothetical protein
MDKVETVLSIAATVLVAREVGLVVALEEAVSQSLPKLEPDAEEIAKSIEKVFRESSTSGYSAFTKVEWEVCKPGFCWNSWEKYDTGWLQVNEGGVNYRGWFLTEAEAFRAAARECEIRIRMYERNRR